MMARGIPRFRRALAAAAMTVMVCAGAGAGELKPFVPGSWAGIVQGQPGAPLIVHLWGITCAPCRVEMPEWGKLQASRPGVRIVYVHAERQPQVVDAIGQFLEKYGLSGAEAWYFADRFLDRLRYEIDPTWHGEMPMTLLMGGDGTVRSIVGPVDLDEVRRWIEAQGKSGAQ